MAQCPSLKVWSRADFLQQNSEIRIKIRLGFAVCEGKLREAAVNTGGGSFATAQPNHTKKNTLLGFDIVFLPAGHRKPGSGLSKPGFVVLYPKLRSPTFAHLIRFAGLRENTRQSSKPSFETAKPNPVLLGFEVAKLGFHVLILGFMQMLFFVEAQRTHFWASAF